MKRRIFLIIMLPLLALIVKGQNKVQINFKEKELWKEFGLRPADLISLKNDPDSLISRHFDITVPNLKNLKDSVDLYPFAIQARIHKQGDSTL